MLSRYHQLQAHKNRFEDEDFGFLFEGSETLAFLGSTHKFRRLKHKVHQQVLL
jgi:hypothetical protein